MLGASSSTPKGPPPPVRDHLIYPYRSFRLVAARWAQWTRTVATAPIHHTCDLSKNSCTTHQRPRSLPRAHVRHPCLRQRQKVPMVVVTKRVRTMNRLCDPRGAFGAEMTLAMM